MKNSAGKVFVWDVEAAAPFGDWKTVLWRSFGDAASPDFISIPLLVEEQAEALKESYLAWVYRLGEMRVQGRRVVDHMELRPGFSYWWMTLFAEKCNYSKSTQIDNAIRLMAFENWLGGRIPGGLVLASPNRPLAECLRLWCARLDIAFEWQQMPEEAAGLSWAKRLYKALPHSLRALVWLGRHLYRSWPLRSVGLEEWGKTKGQVTFVSYLFNLVPDAMDEGRFESRYWGHLPGNLQNEGCKTNWLHLYVKDALLDSERRAADVIRKFNGPQNGQVHIALDAFLGAKAIAGTLSDWSRLVWVGWRLRPAFPQAQGTGIDLWPLFKDDWRQSMFGLIAMSNALSLNLFELALGSLPRQRVGVYLQENQGWEFGFIQAWKASGHGRLVGCPHSTVRYWDLRYFFDRRCYPRTGTNDLPLPDQVALNGAAALVTYRNGGYPAGAMVEVEALRYHYLEKISGRQDLPALLPNGGFRVLVLGDYLLRDTRKQMRLLEKAVQYLPENIKITVKSHPACQINAADYPGLLLEMAGSPVQELLPGYNAVFTCCTTSAAVEAYCAGLPVVSFLELNTLNLSPLRGCEGVLFASTPEELAKALLFAVTAPRQPTGRQDFFTIDPKLPRWRGLLLEGIG